MDEAFRASDRVLKKAADDKQVPWCTVCLVTVILMSHTLVLMGNLDTAAAFSEIGYSTGGWSGVGLQLANSLDIELEEVLKEVAHMLTEAIGEIMEVQTIIDMITGYQAKSIDSVMASNASKALMLLEAHGIMDNSHLHGVAGMISKSMTTSAEKLSGSIKESIKQLLDKLKPALIQVGKFIIKFGEKVQAIIESFSITLDRVQKVFDQVMASLSGGGSNEALMMHQTFHMFDAMNTGAVTVAGLQDVAHLYDVPALQGSKSEHIVKKFDADKSGDLNHEEFTKFIHSGDVPSLLSVVLRSFGKSLAKVAGQVGGSKFRGEIADDTADYLQLMTAKNHTKVHWICDHLGNGSLPLPFTAGLLISLALKVDDPNTHKTVPTGAYVVTTLQKLHPKGFGKAMDKVTNSSFYASQGYSPDTHATVVERLTYWSTMTDPYADVANSSASAAGSKSGTNDAGDKMMFLEDAATVSADGTVDVKAGTMKLDRKLAETMKELAYKVAEQNMRAHLDEVEEEHLKLMDQTFGSETAQYLLLHHLGGRRASSDHSNANNPAVAATRTQIPALPPTLEFAKWLSWNATHTAKLFNEWSFKYQKTSSNAIDSFATQVQSMVKKIQGFIKMMMKYSTPEGIDNLENTLIDYAEAQLKAMLFVTKKRVNVLVQRNAAAATATHQRTMHGKMDVVEKVKKVLESPLVHLAPSVAKELEKSLDAKADHLTSGQLGVEVTKLLESVAETAQSSVSTSLDDTVATSFLHIETSKNIKAMHARGVGSVDKNLVVELGKDVQTALARAQSPTMEDKSRDHGIPEEIEENLAELVQDCVALLHALTHALPQASKALIFAKKEVSMLSKTLENIFKVFQKKGPEIFDAIDLAYARVWKMWFFTMILLPLIMLFYAFWAGGFFGGPGTFVDPDRVRRKNVLAKVCGGMEDCCRCICGCHEFQGYGGAELCFWSVCLFLQHVVLFLFIMALIITLIAAIQFFLASGCAQIYLLGDESICGHVLSNLKMFLDTIFDGVTDMNHHCAKEQLLTCELIGHKMKAAAEYTVIGSFMAAFFTFQLIIESGQLHSRALTRIRFEQEWTTRHPIGAKPSEQKSNKGSPSGSDGEY
jgi:hypothetical protein